MSAISLCVSVCVFFLLFFFFNDTATTEIYTLSLHDALPISLPSLKDVIHRNRVAIGVAPVAHVRRPRDRKSTRLNSSHLVISYAVFCLKKKKTAQTAGAGSTTCNWSRAIFSQPCRRGSDVRA